MSSMIEKQDLLFSVVTHDIGSDRVDRTASRFQSADCFDESGSLLSLLKTISIGVRLRC